MSISGHWRVVVACNLVQCFTLQRRLVVNMTWVPAEEALILGEGAAMGVSEAISESNAHYQEEGARGGS